MSDVVFSSGTRTLSHGDLTRRGAQAATGFASLGVTEGDAIAILLRNDLAVLEAMIGAGLIGAYAVPVNWHYLAEECGYILKDSAAKVLLVHADLWPRVAAAVPAGVRVLTVATPPEVALAYGVEPASPEDATDWDAWRAGFQPYDGPPAASRGSMIYTSGTTGHPKGVRRAAMTEDQQRALIGLVTEGYGLKPGVRALMTGPLYHSAPNAYARGALTLPASLHLMPRFDAEETLRLIEELRISHILMVPTMFVRLLQLPDAVKRRHDLSSLEFVVHGAAPCPAEIKRRMIDWWGPVINEYYGSTEAGLITVASSAEALARPGTVGRALPGVEIRLLDESGLAVAPGEIGEVYVRSTRVPDFTYQNQDATRREIERDGFVTNGDLGLMDEAGYLHLRDRRRDMVISGGVNIYPAEIEAVLLDLAGVGDCAVFGIPDAEFGEALAAAIEPAPGAELTDAEVTAYLKNHLAAFKVPRRIEFHASLPREDSGKIFKKRLKEPYWRNAGRAI